MGCVTSKNVDSKRECIQSLQDSNSSVKSELFQFNEFIEADGSTTSKFESMNEAVPVRQGATARDREYASNELKRIISDKISDRVAYFERISRQELEELKLEKRRSAINPRWIIQEMVLNNRLQQGNRDIPKERPSRRNQTSSAISDGWYADDLQIRQRVDCWKETVQQRHWERVLESSSLDRALKRRSSKIGAPDNFLIFRNKYFSIDTLCEERQEELLEEKVQQCTHSTDSKPMSRILNIAEKPSAAKELAYALAKGAKVQVQRSNQRIKVYEFQYELGGRKVIMIFTSVAGHIKELDFEEPYRSWESCGQWELFDPVKTPVKEYVPKDKKNIEFELKNQARQCEELILWLDCDSEGEKIAHEVLEICKAANPIFHDATRVKRARFSAITALDATNALKRLTTLHYPTIAMVSTRQEIDLRAGAAFTRFLTINIPRKFCIPLKNDKKIIISYGPCQFPTLGLIVDRLLTIRAFQPLNFYYLQLFIDNPNDTNSAEQKLCFSWKRKNLFDRYCCGVLYELCHSFLMTNDFNLVIKDVTKTRKTRRRPLPLDTVELQRLASRVLHLSSDKTMKAAEYLYSQGYISYPRTETNIFPSTIDLRRLLLLQQNDCRWNDFVTRLLQYDGICVPRQGTKDDKAHPPIHPTKPSPANGFMDHDSNSIYELVTRRFLACCASDAVGYETQITLQVGFESFSLRGLSIEAPEYLEVYPYDRCEGLSLFMKEGVTSAPKPLSESDLLGLMDTYGIGTDATVAEHIRKIQEREYVIKQKDVFYPMALGLALVEAFEACGALLARPTCRAEQEQLLKQISQETQEASDVLYKALVSFSQNLSKLKSATDIFYRVFSSHFDPI
eukprot:jgi/Galph1/4360/GphlegSOOS_G2984.1